jgi:DNA mismatch repair protein MutS2
VNVRHLVKLELPKILDQLAEYADFSASVDLARSLLPVTERAEIEWRQETTGEARLLLEESPGTGVGGAHDVRPLVEAARRESALPPQDLLEIRDTLEAGRRLHRALTRQDEPFPNLAVIAARIDPCPGLIAEINRCIDPRGNIRDDATPELARIRRETRVAHDRIREKLEGIINARRYSDVLQESLITQREGRYVVPVKADFKGRIQGIVHDVSASGATVFIEPLPVVDLNNAWRALQVAEQEEMRRILLELSGQVAHHGYAIVETVETLAQLDLHFAKAKYAEALDASRPEIVPFHKSAKSGAHPRATIRLLGARHPLLDPQAVVPIDVTLDEATQVVVITGPNTGGKTVSLKTVGLLTVMAQAGLHIPAEPGSALSPFEDVYVDIGDEQSIEQSLSTFSAHLTNIISFLHRAGTHSLVILDELGAGTDPAEGSALARALLDHFRGRGAMTFVATHYPELKSYAQLTPGVANASVEFDPETLRPTYRLSIGLPGRSNAFAIAQQLGLDTEIVDAAQGMVSREDKQTEDMLSDIHQLRIQEAQARDAARTARVEAEELAEELRRRLDGIEEERREIIAEARQEAEAAVDRLREDVRALRRRMRAASEPADVLEQIKEATEALQADLPEPERLRKPSPPPEVTPPAPERAIRPGDAVWVRPLNAKGEVLEVGKEEVEVQVGPARTRVQPHALELRDAPPPPEERPAVRYSEVASPGTELDLRGATVEEALQKLDRYLDTASRAGLPQVRIIHGKGTGALRRAVRDFMMDYPLVTDFEGGGFREGGEGVTVATLAQV